MTDTLFPTSAHPLVWVQEDVKLRENKRVRRVYILEPSQPADLKETIEALIEIGLSEVERMREVFMRVRLSNPSIHQPLSFDIRIASLAEVNVVQSEHIQFKPHAFEHLG